MTPTPLVVIGAGGFGREVLDIVSALSTSTSSHALIGVVDDAPSRQNLELLQRRGIDYVGTVDEWLEPEHDPERYIVAIGAPNVRRRIVERAEQRGRQAATLIHPRAIIGTGCTFSPGSVVCAGAIISTNVHCGPHVHINPGVILGHDTRVGPFVSVNPGATVSGMVEIAQEALVGANATVLQNLTIGSRAVVGAAACVVRDVHTNTVVKGVPAQ